MNHRIRTVTAGAALLTTGLLAGLAIGSPAATATEPTAAPPTTIDMPMTGMDGTDEMMTGDMAAVATMMTSADMATMHTAMHEQMAGVMDPDVIAACEAAHELMAADTAGSDTSNTGAPDAEHESHHEETGS